MKPRERQLAAIRHEMPDRIPVDAISVENADALAQYLSCTPDSVLEQLGLDGRMVQLSYGGELPESDIAEGVNEWGSDAGG